MKLLRNPEVRRSLLCHLVLTALFAAAGFALSLPCGLLLSGAGISFTLADLISARLRYKRMEKLCGEIDRVLHGCETLDFSSSVEGELSVLQSELSKMTVRLREQSDTLKRDKTYLADSIADISHQLKTPLTAMNLVVSLLGEPGLTEERRAALSRELTVLLARMQWLVKSLLKISKLDTGTVVFRRDELSAAALTARALEPLAVLFELRGQTVRTEIGSERFVGDLSWTAEALGNILKNCSEHTPEGGTVTVSAAENAVCTEIRVTDSGAGIAPQDLPHVFERFYRGSDSAEGSAGIGLALARMIVAGQGGTLKAENLRSGGAAFTMRFYRGTI